MYVSVCVRALLVLLPFYVLPTIYLYIKHNIYLPIIANNIFLSEWHKYNMCTDINRKMNGITLSIYAVNMYFYLHEGCACIKHKPMYVG